MLKRKLTERVELILPFDNAVKGGWEEYVKDFDRSKLVIEGKPTVFVVEPAAYEQKTMIERETDRRSKMIASFACGTKDVQGYVVEKGGETITLPPPKIVNADPWGSVVDPAWLKEANFDDDVLELVSIVVRRISGLSPL